MTRCRNIDGHGWHNIGEFSSERSPTDFGKYVNGDKSVGRLVLARNLILLDVGIGLSEYLVFHQFLVLHHLLGVDIQPDRPLHRVAVCVLQRLGLISASSLAAHFHKFAILGERKCCGKHSCDENHHHPFHCLLLLFIFNQQILL